MPCPRRYGIPYLAIVTYYLVRGNPDCAPSPNGGLVAQEGGFVSKKKFSTGQKKQNGTSRAPSGNSPVVQGGYRKRGGHHLCGTRRGDRPPGTRKFIVNPGK